MNAIRVRKRVESETLHLPELKDLVGKTVEIIILEDAAAPVPRFKDPGCLAALAPKKPFDPKQLEAMRDSLTKEQFETLWAIASQDLIDVDAILEIRAASMI